ncbi:MAG: transcriptional regulator BetI [Pseudomonadota bacterium]
MSRISTELSRKASLVDAAIAEIAARGSLDVTVGRIARRAGVSSALAHHYFGSKDRILIAAMRQILRQLAADHRQALVAAGTPRARLSATIRASFGQASFQREVIVAWLAFYVRAQGDPVARRLLLLYQARLRSNLLYALRPLVGSDAPNLAETLAALIDGHFVREAAQSGPADGAKLIASVEAVTDLLLEAYA